MLLKIAIDLTNRYSISSFNKPWDCAVINLDAILYLDNSSRREPSLEDSSVTNCLCHEAQSPSYQLFALADVPICRDYHNEESERMVYFGSVDPRNMIVSCWSAWNGCCAKSWLVFPGVIEILKEIVARKWLFYIVSFNMAINGTQNERRENENVCYPQPS